MAKVTAPLLSFGASGQLAKTLVFFPWKGVKAVRSYVVPSNPNTPAQDDQRGYLEDAVALVHTAQQEAAPFDADDVAAYNAWAATRPTPRTWFNQFCANYMYQHSHALKGAIFLNGILTPGVDEIAIAVDFLDEAITAITAGNFHYGTSKTNLMFTEPAVIAGHNASTTLTPLVTGTRYYIQFRATVHIDYLGVESGIYSDIAG